MRLGGLDFGERDHDLSRTFAAPSLMQQFSQIVASSRPIDGKDLAGQLAVLNDADSALYRQAFAATHAGRHAQASQLLGQIQDQSLAGHVLAERYLDTNSAPSYRALAAWLKDYADLPQAARIYAKASLSKAEGSPDPTPALAQTIVRGNLDETGSELEATITLPETDDKIPLDDRRLGAQINALLRHGKSAEAEQIFSAAKAQRTLTTALAKQAPAAIAAAAFFEGDASRVQTLPEQTLSTAPLAAWTAGLDAWRTGAYRTAARRFALFAANKDLNANDRAAGYFWQARALQKIGFTDHAQAALQNAADAPRSFYGMLAQAQLGNSLTPSWTMPELTSEHLQLIAATPAGRRGLALLQIDAPDLAVAELQRIKIQGDRARATALLALAHAANLPALALSLGSVLKSVDGRNFDGALYPVPPWQPAAGTDGDRAFIYAVMRQESGFDPAAVSQCGARGLMQLMPRTAQGMTATDLRDQDIDLFNPTFNMTLGMRYIQHLAKQPDIANNLLLVIAAYNGGPGNLARWLKTPAHGDDPLLFIETLPARETRNYIARVLSGYWIYQARLGQAQDSLHALAKGQWPNFAPVVAPTQEADAAAGLSISYDQGFLKVASR